MVMYQIAVNLPKCSLVNFSAAPKGAKDNKFESNLDV